MLKRFLIATQIAAMGGMAFAQEKSPEPLPEVLVTATRTAHAVEDTPGAAYVVTREQMTSRNLLGADNALNTVPGVFNRRGKGLMDTQSAITLRGIPDAKRSLVLLDGMPLNDGYTGAVDFGGMALDDLERIEVTLGAAASLYGNNAMGGVVNLMTHMPDKREYGFRVGYGDPLNSDFAAKRLWRAHASVGDRFDNGLRLLASIGGTQTDGFITDLNVQTNKPTAGITGWTGTTSNTGATRYIIGARGENSWRDNHAALRAAFDLPERGELRFAWQRTGYRYGYGNPRTDLRNAAGAEVWNYGTVQSASYLGGAGETERDLYQLSLETALGATRLKASAGYSKSGTNWYTTPGTTAATTTNGGPGTIASTPNSLGNLDAQLTWTPVSGHVLVLGTALRSEKADSEEHALTDWRNPTAQGATTYTAGGRTRTWGLFAQDEVSLTDALTGYAGLRWDDWRASDGRANSVGAAGYPKTYDSRSAQAVSPKFGLVYRLSPDATLRTSLGRAFRAPTVYELYRTWLSSTGTTFAGNPNLTPETLTAWDIGGDFKPWAGAQLKATAYANRLRDMIYRRTVTATYQEYINAGRARGQGMELDLRQSLTGGWTLLAGAAWNDTRIIENSASRASEGNQFIQVPHRTGHLGVEWAQGNWQTSAMARQVGKRYQTDANTDTVSSVYTSYDPYTVVDFKVGYRIDSHFKVSLAIDNVANNNYFAYYRAPGRSYFLELAGQF